MKTIRVLAAPLKVRCPCKTIRPGFGTRPGVFETCGGEAIRSACHRAIKDRVLYTCLECLGTIVLEPDHKGRWRPQSGPRRTPMGWARDIG